jgi:hypothetical protein
MTKLIVAQAIKSAMHGTGMQPVQPEPILTVSKIYTLFESD